MKKIIIVFLSVLCFITACGKNSSGNILKEINKKFDKSSGYKIVGSLVINNNDDTYNYDVIVDYKKDDFYKVVITNVSNNFMQIILKNGDGVFLITPSLNKSFRFQSDWPYNNSQAYLLDAIINDLNEEENIVFEKKNDKYLSDVSAHYSNNSKLTKQRIIFDENYDLSKVTVYDNDNSICMEFNVSKIKYSPKYSDDYFELDTIVDIKENEEKTDEVKATVALDDIVYPLFLPDGTKLIGEERVVKDSGERVIMTYDGEKNFLLVEETLDVFNDFTIIPSTGEPFHLMDTIGVMTDNSLSWSSGNIEYYLVSDVMSQEELTEIAQSIIGVISMK